LPELGESAIDDENILFLIKRDCAGFDKLELQFLKVPIHIFSGNDKHAISLKKKVKGSVGAERSVVFIKNRTDIGDGPVCVVGGAFDDKSDAVWTIPFKRHLFVIVCICTGCFFDRPFNVVLRHIYATGIDQGISQSTIGIRITVLVIFFDRVGDLFQNFRRPPASPLILCSFSMFNLCPLSMSSHIYLSSIVFNCPIYNKIIVSQMRY